MADEEPTNVPKAQDLHTMLDLILESYRDLEKTGFVWDLNYNGKVYRDVEFVLFTPFLKLDSDEADKLCGKFTVRTHNVAQLCRYCECPTEHTDNPIMSFRCKTQARIQALANNEDADGLKAISQQNIQNCLCKLRFGSHNKQGVHGACPMEMLHATHLGVFCHEFAFICPVHKPNFREVSLTLSGHYHPEFH